MMRLLDMIHHVNHKIACDKLHSGKNKTKTEGYPAHTMITHYKVTARACPGGSEKNTRQHLL